MGHFAVLQINLMRVVRLKILYLKDNFMTSYYSRQYGAVRVECVLHSVTTKRYSEPDHVLCLQCDLCYGLELVGCTGSRTLPNQIEVNVKFALY